MTSINAGGAFYRVQNSLSQNSENVSKSMQRLASGQQNIAPGDRTASSAVAWGMKAEAASLKIGMQNGTEALQAVEMVNNDIKTLQDIVVRLEEIQALATNAFNTTTDKAALTAEATSILAEMTRITTSAEWKGNDIIGGANVMGFGRNGGELDVKLDAFEMPIVAVGLYSATADFEVGGVTKIDVDLATEGVANNVKVTLGKKSDGTTALSAGDPGFGIFTNSKNAAGEVALPAAGGLVFENMFDTPVADGAATRLTGATISAGDKISVRALSDLKKAVDAMAVAAGGLYNEVTNTMSHLGSLNAGYALDVASKMDVDFAGETAELAKGQILAQAGTAMLAQANAQGQSMLALLQS